MPYNNPVKSDNDNMGLDDASEDDFYKILDADFNAENLNSSEKIHNQNCYSYLKALANALDELDKAHLPKKLLSCLVDDDFSSSISYANRYSLLIKTMSDDADNFYENLTTTVTDQQKMDALDKFYISVYLNENDVLSATYEKIKPVVDAHVPSNETSVEKEISRVTRDPKELDTDSRITPQRKNSKKYKAKAFVGMTLLDSFRPMEDTSLPAVRDTPWLPSVKQIRLGTQAMQDPKKGAFCNPGYLKFLEAQKRQAKRDLVPFPFSSDRLKWSTCLI